MLLYRLTRDLIVSAVFLASFGVSLCISPAAHSATTPFLKEFQRNPERAKNLLPEKSGYRLAPNILQEKIGACRRGETRQWIRRNAELTQKTRFKSYVPEIEHFEAIRPDEDARRFLESPRVYTDIYSLDAYRAAEVARQPWSGDYWPLRNGGAARRYFDKAFPPAGVGSTWQQANEYVKRHPPQTTESDLLSPAEKYDRWVGDENYTLTQANWAEGQNNAGSNGVVEPWMGICHGWAPASFMEPRPEHSVIVRGFQSNSEVLFRPDDLKALASLKWANGINVRRDHTTLATRMIGTRCTIRRPPVDRDSGRTLDESCFDINPGTWHEIVIGQIALARRPFIIDASYDYEVWNQPVVSYRIHYFNPSNFKTTDSLDEAKIRYNARGFRDKFRRFRQTQKISELVGVIMSVTYMAETRPSGREVDSTDYDAKTTVHYHYDLELDANGEILGGEWYQNAHPDFVWMPLRDSTAINEEDLKINNLESALALANIASKSMVPLRFLLDQLLSLAQAPIPHVDPPPPF